MNDLPATAFVRLCELHKARGVAPLCDLPGLWTCQVDADWRLEVNGQVEQIGNVPPACAMVYWKDSPVGLIDPYGGCLIAGAEPDLIAAIEAAIEAEATHV